MGRRSIRTALLSLGAGAIASKSVAVSESNRGPLRRQRRAGRESRVARQTSSSSQQQQQQGLDASLAGNRRLTESNKSPPDAIEAKSRRFFVPSSHEELYLDMRELILELNVDMSMSITMAPEPAPAQTNTPSIDCANAETCANYLLEQIFQVSERVGTTEAQSDQMSPQSKARDWIIEECDAVTPIEYCGETQLILNEQRYALAVMYFSLGGDEWNVGSNPGPDKSAGPGKWLSGLNYCDWGSEITSANGSYDQMVCDEFGNVLYLNLRE
jgi:hypothetical protein